QPQTNPVHLALTYGAPPPQLECQPTFKWRHNAPFSFVCTFPHPAWCDDRAVDGAGCAAARQGGPALHRGVLLQSAVGASAGVLRPFPEKPLPAAQEDRGDGADCCAE